MKTYRVSAPRYRALCVEEWPRERAERWVADPRGRCLREMETPEGDRIFVKHHCRSIVKSIADVIARRRSPSRRAFDAGVRLREACVPAVRPIAVIERRLPGESFTLLEFLHGATLRAWILDRFGTLTGAELQARKSLLWRRLATAVARLHRARVRQRDLKALNIMVGDAADGPRPTFVDLEGMQCLETLPTIAQRSRDLARLRVSLRTPEVRAAGIDEERDWPELLEHYLEACEGDFPRDPPLDHWLERTGAWAARKEVRNRRRGREIA